MKTESILLDFFINIQKRKIVLFGAGPTGVEFLRTMPVSVSYVVDNDTKLWGSTVMGLPVRPPEDLREEPHDNLMVVVASGAIYEIASQLQEYGLELGKNISISPMLQSEHGFTSSPLPELIVSCIGHLGGLYSVKPSKDKYIRLVEGNCRGLVRYKEGFLLALEERGVLELDSDFKVKRQTVEGENKNLHGLALDIEKGVFYLNETKNDLIGIYDLDNFQRIDEIQPFKIEKRGSDKHHINDVLVYHEWLLVSMFSTQGIWRQEIWNDGCLMALNPKTGKIEARLMNGLSQPHSIMEFNGEIFCCNSMRREVRKGSELLCEFTGYTRGLACDGRYICVGQSKMRRLSRFSGSYTNISNDCGIHFWDRMRMTSTFFKLPAQGVFDIVVI